MKEFLIVVPDLKSGGAERSLLNFLIECDKTKYKIDLLLLRKEGIFINQVPDEVNIIYPNTILQGLYSTKREGKTWIKIIKIFGTILGIAFSFGDRIKGNCIRWKVVYKHLIPKVDKHYDVAMSYLEGECIYLLCDKISSNSKVCWFHNDYDKLGFSAKQDLPFFEQMDKIITISDECKKILKKNFPSIQGKFTVLPNITSQNLIMNRSNEFYPVELEEDEKILKLLTIGRLDHQKGYDIAVKVAKELKNKNVDFQWIIIGAGPLEKEILEMITLHGVEDCFIIIGNRENPYPYIKSCDVIVQTSRFEGKSIVLDEAKILSKPIVVTNYPTVKDQILHKKEGLICDFEPVNIADSIVLLKEDTNIKNDIICYLESQKYGNADIISEYYKIIG